MKRNESTYKEVKSLYVRKTGIEAMQVDVLCEELKLENVY